MSERDKLQILAVFVFITFAIYSECDSRFWRSQIRDLQRRIAVLEQQIEQRK